MVGQLDKHLRLPPLWPVTWVVEAFGGALSARTIRAKLRSEGALEIESKPHLVDPVILRAMWPSVYHRVIELQLEKRAERKHEANERC
jgi:hypothetical protein